MLPPLNSSTVTIDTKTRNKYSDDRFKEPTSVRKLKEKIPVAYMQNLDTFSQSINKSTSNLTKDKRFKRRTIFEKDLEGLPSPSSYNLSALYSIQAYSKASKQAEVRDRLRANKRFDRFDQKAYFKELDRGMLVVYIL